MRDILKRIFIGVCIGMALFFLKGKVFAATITPNSSKFDVRYTTLYCDSYNSGGSCIYDSWGSWSGQVNVGSTISSPSGTSDAFNTIGWTLNIPNMVAGNTYTFDVLIKIEPSSTISAANTYLYFKNYFEVVNCAAGTAANNRSTDNVSSFAYTLSQTGSDNIVKLSVSITLSSNANYISFYLRDSLFNNYRNWTKYFWDNSVTVTSLKASYTEGSNSYIQQTTQAVINLFNQNNLLIGDDPATWFPSNNYDVTDWEQAESDIGGSMQVDVSNLSFSGYATPFSWIWSRVNDFIFSDSTFKIFGLFTAFLTISFIGLVLGRS